MIKKISLGICLVLMTAILFLTGFASKIQEIPADVYHVYLDGKRIGTIEQRSELEQYIDSKQQSLKDRYDVDNVYLPVGLTIEKDVAYHPTFNTVQDVYNTLETKDKPFTIKGYQVTIKSKDSETIVNVLDKEMFKSSIDKTMRVFLDAEQYNQYLNNNQEAITGNKGKLIENVYIDQTISYKEAYLSTEETIFMNEKDLLKYLLYGSVEEEKTYTVKDGDTMQSIAATHNLNIKEFLIANPDIMGENHMLAKGQVVKIGLIKPQVDVVLEEHTVDTVSTDYRTNIVYDNNIMAGYSYTKVKGSKGESRVTQKVKSINGQTESIVVVNTTVIKPSVDATVVYGGKQSSNIGDPSNWFWPTNIPYIITSYWEPRWGTFHDAIDISGTGFGSPIYAANNGVVADVSNGWPGGNQIIINHNNGYYTLYAHLNAVFVKPGQVVSRGQRIGAMGHTGQAYGTHLHFAVWVGFPYNGGYHTNPLKYRYN